MTGFVDPAGAAYIIRFVREATGVVLTPDKAYLIEARLRPVADAVGATSLAGLVTRMLGTEGEDIRQRVIEAMTTHETSFFRDASVFVSLREILTFRFRRDKPQKSLRIWSAACSTGQEPYSIAVLTNEVFRGLGWDVSIVGTDIAPEVVLRAKAATYNRQEVNRGLPMPFLTRYFTQNRFTWKAKPDLTDRTRFEVSNLLEETPPGGPFDIILCRNVLIYYDDPTSRKVLARLHAALATKGVLVLGGTENLIGRESGFTALERRVPGVYEKKDAG